MYSALATLTLAFHLLFIVFCLIGGLLCLRDSKWVYVHVPSAIWGALAELLSIVCPLTYLENFLLSKAGESGYQGDFIGQYLLFVIYPAGLTWQIQIWLGLGLICFNLVIYSWVWRKRSSVENDEFKFHKSI
tara:strand:- start:104 stop:499 length:396 start_codon:yes stop_codon:yes gene_type:complete